MRIPAGGFRQIPVRDSVLLLACLGLLVLLARAGAPPGENLHAPSGLPAEVRSEPLRSVKTDSPMAALTFNLTWGEEIHKEIRSILAARQAEATFFIAGPWAAAHPDAVREILEEGHEVGSLGYRQINWKEYPYAAVRDEILRAQRELQPLLGRPPAYLRPPSGEFSDAVLDASAELGYTLVLWNIDSHDWATPGVDTISRRVIRRAVPGSIILFHASDTAQETPEALRTVLAELSAKGFRFVTLSDLLGLVAG